MAIKETERMKIGNGSKNAASTSLNAHTHAHKHTQMPYESLQGGGGALQLLLLNISSHHVLFILLRSLKTSHLGGKKRAFLVHH